MREPHLVRLEGRRFFYALVQGDFPEYIYRSNPDAAASQREADLTEMSKVYYRLALATIDVGLGADATGRWLAELAYAAKLSLDVEPTMLPIHSLRALFAFQAVVDPEATRTFARVLAARPSRPKGKEAAAPHVELLVTALCHSILGDDRAAAAVLASIAKLGPMPAKLKSAPSWLAAMQSLAEACLVGRPTDLTKPLQAVAARAEAYFGPGFEDQLFEPCFAVMALSFVARARDRGFDVSGPDPHASLPLELLRLRRGPLPDHPWHSWPAPDDDLRARIVESFQRENVSIAKPTAKRRPAGEGRTPSRRPKPPAKTPKLAKKKKLTTISKARGRRRSRARGRRRSGGGPSSPARSPGGRRRAFRGSRRRRR